MRNVKIKTEAGFKKCFACGSENPIGLKLNFRKEGETAMAEFFPDQYHQGWPGIVHGGLICTLLDEAMGYVTRYQGVKTITAKMEIKFSKPARSDQKLYIIGEITQKNRKLVKTRGRIELEDGSVVADATALMYVFA